MTRRHASGWGWWLSEPEPSSLSCVEGAQEAQAVGPELMLRQGLRPWCGVDDLGQRASGQLGRDRRPGLGEVTGPGEQRQRHRRQAPGPEDDNNDQGEGGGPEGRRQGGACRESRTYGRWPVIDISPPMPCAIWSNPGRLA